MQLDDGNAFAIIGAVRREIARHVSSGAAERFSYAAQCCSSYDELLGLVMQTVHVTLEADDDESDDSERVYSDRDEDDSCEHGTQGCSIGTERHARRVRDMVSRGTVSVTVDGHGFFECRATTLDSMIVDHLPTSIRALREHVQSRSEIDCSDIVSASELLIMLGDFADAQIEMTEALARAERLSSDAVGRLLVDDAAMRPGGYDPHDDIDGEQPDECHCAARDGLEHECVCGIVKGVELCQWFALCENDAARYIEHPVLGLVPACASCAKRASVTS